ncbi:proline iminopeptidase [Mollisia scopiformis]|uniref:Proline iminopeptidase n=1 Tax=Mollisia scopiformis TaxID=149040 RepID=A0A194X1I3_MOLSC|nr:proline iminopeptidase [Mollisia scopiformis]KUJ13707.1 proline iminopeptidase [Mollisia scopiformis]
MYSPKVTEGTVDFDIPAAGKPCKTWYKIIGDLSCGITPLMIIHGGPGLTHHYLLPLTDLNEKFGIPLIFYDQLGNCLSTHLPEKMGDESFWTESLFHAELTNLISKLSLHSYDVLGHSWGGMMASTFAGSQPKGLRKLILSNTTATGDAWDEAYAEYRRKMPQDIQETMKKHEDDGTTHSVEYKEMMDVFNEKHFCKKLPFPDFQTSLEWKAKDMTVSLTMHGPNKWVVTGSMVSWTAVPVIKNILVPTLVINGIDEGASDEAIAPFVEGIHDVKWVKLHNSTHMPHWEEKDNYLQIVGQWLQTR